MNDELKKKVRAICACLDPLAAELALEAVRAGTDDRANEPVFSRLEVEAIKVVHARDRLHEAGEAIIAAIDEADHVDGHARS